MNQKNSIIGIVGIIIGIVLGFFFFSGYNNADMTKSHDMHSTMTDMTARMQGKTGDELDKIFLEDMIVHHQGAVDMAVVLQENTTRPELQNMANDIISVQTEEIRMMHEWLDTWFQ
jgi:uncharacterized protein (DUF305 family)